MLPKIHFYVEKRERIYDFKFLIERIIFKDSTKRIRDPYEQNKQTKGNVNQDQNTYFIEKFVDTPKVTL